MTLTTVEEQFLTESIRAACMLEATARKPGNVHPEASFEDLTFEDFVRSANIVAPIISKTGLLSVGLAIESALIANHHAVSKNTNLGIVLLLAPLAAVPMTEDLQTGVEKVLDELSVEDAVRVYNVINVIKPGGMGAVKDQDLAEAPTVTLKEAMHLAAGRDSIAAQYANGYQLLWEHCIPYLKQRSPNFQKQWEEVIQTLYLKILAVQPDTLIARKCGMEIAELASVKAQEILSADWPFSEASHSLFKKYDEWLREEGHQRNPGTTADIVAAALFAGFRDEIIQPPFRFRTSF